MEIKDLQQISIQYLSRGTSEGVNRLLYGIFPPGLYTPISIKKVTGGYEILNTDNAAASWTALFNSTAYKLAIKIIFEPMTGASILTPAMCASTWTETNCYLVIRYTWRNLPANYAEFHFVAVGDITADDVVLGKVSNTTGEYADQSMSSFRSLETLSTDFDRFHITAQTPVDGTVSVTGGTIRINGVLRTVADVPALSIPTNDAYGIGINAVSGVIEAFVIEDYAHFSDAGWVLIGTVAERIAEPVVVSAEDITNLVVAKEVIKNSFVGNLDDLVAPLTKTTLVAAINDISTLISTLEGNVSDLVGDVGDQNTLIGDMATLKTDEKDVIVDAINELWTVLDSASGWHTAVEQALINAGVALSNAEGAVADAAAAEGLADAADTTAGTAESDSEAAVTLAGTANANVILAQGAIDTLELQATPIDAMAQQALSDAAAAHADAVEVSGIASDIHDVAEAAETSAAATAAALPPLEAAIDAVEVTAAAALDAANEAVSLATAAGTALATAEDALAAANAAKGSAESAASDAGTALANSITAMGNASDAKSNSLALNSTTETAAADALAAKGLATTADDNAADAKASAIQAAADALTAKNDAALAIAVATGLGTDVGDLADLDTTDKTSIVNAINEVADTFLGRPRNYINNPYFRITEIWRENTLARGGSNNSHSLVLNRWRALFIKNDGVPASALSVTPSGTDGVLLNPGAVTLGASTHIEARLAQYIENPAQFLGKKITLSFEVKFITNAPSALKMKIAFPGGASVNQGVETVTLTTPAAGTWTRVSHTFTIPANYTFPGNGSTTAADASLYIALVTYWQRNTTSADGFYVRDAQLIIGDTYVQAEIVPQGQDFLECLRYGYMYHGVDSGTL